MINLLRPLRHLSLVDVLKKGNSLEVNNNDK